MGVSGRRKYCSSRTSMAELTREEDITVGFWPNVGFDVDANFNTNEGGGRSGRDLRVVEKAEDAWMRYIK